MKNRTQFSVSNEYTGEICMPNIGILIEVDGVSCGNTNNMTFQTGWPGLLTWSI